MRKILTTAALLTMSITMTAANETIVLRIKGMRCEECAHKVTTVLRQLEGVEGVSFDLEKRTAIVEFDASKTCTDSINGRLAATGRYKSSPYSPADVIKRGMGLQMSDMHCQKCADRIVSRLSSVEGVDSLAPHLDKHYVFVRYDANKTCKAVIRQALSELGFTPVNYYTSKTISFAYFNISKEAATDNTIEEVLALDGVDDANVNPKNGALAITYVNTETNEEKLLEEIKAAGIDATVPAPHECTEAMEKAE